MTDVVARFSLAFAVENGALDLCDFLPRGKRLFWRLVYKPSHSLKNDTMIEFLSSSIGKKLIMGLSGLFLLVFIAVHLALNLTALVSPDLYRLACEFMDTNLLVRAMVPVLALGFIVHILFSIYVEFKNWTARPSNIKYAVPCKSQASSWASKNMFVLGVIVFLFLLLHFMHFWQHMQLQTFLGREGKDPYELVVATFSNPVIAILYIAWFVALYFHISHGFWSAFQSLGVSNTKWLPRLQFLAKLYAICVFIGFAVIPVFFLYASKFPCCG